MNGERKLRKAAQWKTVSPSLFRTLSCDVSFSLHSYVYVAWIGYEWTSRCWMGLWDICTRHAQNAPDSVYRTKSSSTWFPSWKGEPTRITLGIILQFVFFSYQCFTYAFIRVFNLLLHICDSLVIAQPKLLAERSSNFTHISFWTCRHPLTKGFENLQFQGCFLEGSNEAKISRAHLYHSTASWCNLRFLFQTFFCIFLSFRAKRKAWRGLRYSSFTCKYQKSRRSWEQFSAMKNAWER